MVFVSFLAILDFVWSWYLLMPLVLRCGLLFFVRPLLLVVVFSVMFVYVLVLTLSLSTLMLLSYF